MMMRNVLTVLTIFFFTSQAVGQNPNLSTQDKKALKYYQEASALLRRVQYPEAIDPLRKALDRDQNFIEAWQALGLSYFKTGKLDQAIECYEKPIEIDKESVRVPRSYFTLADLYFQKEEYQKAVDFANLYIENRQNETANIKTLQTIIQNSEYILEAIKEPLPYNIKPLPGQANYFKQQYFPVLTVDQQSLIYTGRNRDENIYISRLGENGDWGMPSPISNNINTDLNEGACTISADGRILIFTSCQGRRGFGSCDLYITYKEGNDWAVPENLGIDVNSSSWDVQPTLSADGRTLYFVSDRPGGLGKKDIWKSSKGEDDKWSSPVNIGAPVNTSLDEISPFIHVNGESLYFASKGHAGMGGFDIFMSEVNDGIWSEPTNLGYPLNDRYDQVSLYISSGGEKGYYTIERVVNGEWRSVLHSFDVPPQFRVKRRSVFTIGHVIDKGTRKFLGADIKIFDQSNSELISKVKSDAVTGEYTIVLTEGNEYGLYVEKRGYLFADYSFNVNKIENFNSDNLEIELQSIKEGVSMVLNNIYFEFDSFELKKESYSELQTVYEFLKANRNVSIEIQGYTDDKGTKQYNEALSENRAKSVYQYLLDKKVPPRMLSYKGLGAQNFISPNDTDENRAKNRRIEFVIKKLDN
ncbi:OmpA family protein [Reichenbachiella sp. MALMAid0571]|uniref:OmpA family protein n=1 Tax=Reichenbachiella sp. MALMAid0571 TaxID=3143939 RepID=UPI0032DF65A4